MSIDRIFEFPREKKKRRRYKTVTRRMEVPAADTRRVRTAYGNLGIPPVSSPATARQQARNGFNITTSDAAWLALAQTAATTYCTGEGYKRAVAVATGADIWEYGANENNYQNTYQYRARKARTWTATCEKEVRRRR